MSDGHGRTPETPPGWSAEQPPPYSAPQASPWTAPGSPTQTPYGQPYEPQGEAPQPPPYGPPGPQPPYPQPGHPQSGHPQPGYPQPGYQQPGHQQPGYQQAGYQQGAYQQPGYGYMPPPALRPGIIPLRPLGLGDILDGTIKLIRSNPKAVLGLSAVAALLGAVPLAVGQAVMLGSMGDVLDDPQAASAGLDSFYGIVAQYGGMLVSYAIQFVVVTVLTGVLTRILGRAVFGGNITAAEAWHLSKGRLPALFGVVGLMAAMMVVPLIVLTLVVVALAMNVSSSEGVGLTIGVMGLFVLLFIPYYLFITTRFAFAAPAVVLEGRGPIDAMRRSWHLVTGDFWRVLGILLLTSLLVGLVSGVLSVPFSFGGTLIGMLGGGSPGSAVIAAVFIAAGATLSSMFAYPFQAGVSGLLYADRRMRGEAFDLVLQTAAIEQQRQGWVHASADDLWHPSNSARS
ncbi:glycerophosphoryl diester phosphodiesterase membrane domain-containing protein [Nonomuraea sp. NPDC003560]|uniref:glycerophosphoryl diester phosphodiesterase membrane domain-containing protein n=1 Tax=Nonomuraea sp. NPDC003560 TaxID=3364341 RepID=UPI003699B20A